MKKILRNWFINGVGLALIGWLFTGIEVSCQIYDFLLSALLLTFIIKLMKPVFDIVFLPLNLITLGAFRWIRTVISLGIVIYIANGVNLKEFYFPGIDIGAINIQSFTAPPIISLIIGAILLNLFKKSIRWVIRTK